MTETVYRKPLLGTIRIGIVMGMLLMISTPTFGADIDFDRSSISLNTILDSGKGFFEYMKNVAGQISLPNIRNRQDRIIIRNYGFKNLVSQADTIGTAALKTSTSQVASTVKAAVIGKPLVWPSPMRLSQEHSPTRKGGQLGYELSRDMDLKIMIYDMMANKIFENTIFAGANGARQGYNKVVIDISTWDQFALSAGVYFFLLINDGNVLAKGKMAIAP